MNPILFLAICVFFIIGNSFASEYAFGTKVTTLDSDVGKFVKNVRDGTMISFWDTGSDPGNYDEGDVVYLDIPPIGIANVNDIRLTSFSDHPAGSKVKSTDGDVNAPLRPMPAEMRFLNLYGSKSYDMNDPVYVHQSGTNPLEELAYVDTTAVESKEYIDSNAAKTNPENTQGYDANSQGYSPGSEGNVPSSPIYTPQSQAYTAVISNSNMAVNANDGFSERLPYSGSCCGLLPGATCLTYSDNFKIVVSAYLIDCCPFLVGFSQGRPIEVIRCNSADYYHTLGTLFVKTIPRQPLQKSLIIQAAPGNEGLSLQTIASENAPSNDNSEVSQISDGSNTVQSGQSNIEDLNRIIATINEISANSDSIQTNDIRLISIGEFAAGTKVLDFDPDQNHLVAQPILVSFPRKLSDYAAIRFYDANGNGLCDFPDDIYLDISLRGSSSFGTVSVNDVRLSGPAV